MSVSALRSRQNENIPGKSPSETAIPRWKIRLRNGCRVGLWCRFLAVLPTSPRASVCCGCPWSVGVPTGGQRSARLGLGRTLGAFLGIQAGVSQDVLKDPLGHRVPKALWSVGAVFLCLLGTPNPSSSLDFSDGQGTTEFVEDFILRLFPAWTFAGARSAGRGREALLCRGVSTAFGRHRLHAESPCSWLWE